MRIDLALGGGAPVPSALEKPALITPHFFSCGVAGASTVVAQRSIALASSVAIPELLTFEPTLQYSPSMHVSLVGRHSMEIGGGAPAAGCPRVRVAGPT